MATNSGEMELSTLESWLWEAACVIRGPLDAPRFKDYILPLVFLKRLSDVFDDEVEQVVAEMGSRKPAADLVERDHALVRFYLPEIRKFATQTAVFTTGDPTSTNKRADLSMDIDLANALTIPLIASDKTN